MACRYFLNGKELSTDELKSFMQSVSHERKVQIAPEITSNSYSAISWTPGEAQAARYDLSKQISKITYNVPGSKMANKYGTVLKAFDHNGHEVINKNMKPEELPDAIGKEAADKLLKTEPNGDKHELAGLDLKVGGEGMKGFYDKILVDRANNLAKKFGSKVEQKNLNNNLHIYEGYMGDHIDYEVLDKGNQNKSLAKFKTKKEAEEFIKTKNGDNIHYLPLTPGLKDVALKKGFPLFSAGISLTPVEHDPYKHTPVDTDPFNVNLHAADAALHLTPEEKNLYERHLDNLTGKGGVDNPDGSRSSLYQAVQEHNGKFYNIPTVWNGKRLIEKYKKPNGEVMDVPNAQALENVSKIGWDKFPSYDTPEEADARYEKMHKFMEKDTADYLKSHRKKK